MLSFASCCVFGPAGLCVASAAQVWKLPEKRCVATQRGIAGQGFCKFTIVERPWGSDTPCVVAGSMGGKGVTVWNMESWQQSTELDHNSQEFYSVCVPNGTSIVLGAAGDSKVAGGLNPARVTQGAIGSPSALYYQQEVCGWKCKWKERRGVGLGLCQTVDFLGLP